MAAAPDSEETPVRSTEPPTDGSGMDELAPHVEEQLQQLMAPTGDGQDSGETPALDQHASEPPTRCQGVNKNGSQCKGTIGLNAQGLCSLHATTATREAAIAARQQAALRDQKAQEAQADAVRRSQLAPRAALALKLAERQDRLVDALVDAAVPEEGATGPDGRPLQVDIPLALRLWGEAYGKPGEAAPPPVEPARALDEVVGAWMAARDARRQAQAAEPQG